MAALRGAVEACYERELGLAERVGRVEQRAAALAEGLGAVRLTCTDIRVRLDSVAQRAGPVALEPERKPAEDSVAAAYQYALGLYRQRRYKEALERFADQDPSAMQRHVSVEGGVGGGTGFADDVHRLGNRRGRVIGAMTDFDCICARQIGAVRCRNRGV